MMPGALSPNGHYDPINDGENRASCRRKGRTAENNGACYAAALLPSPNASASRL